MVVAFLGRRGFGSRELVRRRWGVARWVGWSLGRELVWERERWRLVGASGQMSVALGSYQMKLAV